MEYLWLTAAEFQKLYDQSPLLQAEVANKCFKYFMLDFGGIGPDALLVARINQKIVGMIQIGKSADHPQVENFLAIKFVTVHPEYRQQGIARGLLQAALTQAVQQGATQLALSSYMSEGEVLIPVMQELALATPELTIWHRRMDSPYQNARQGLFQRGDRVIVNLPEQGLINRIGKLRWFIEYEKPVKALIDFSDTEAYEIELSALEKA